MLPIPGILWTIAGFAGVGAFTDFYIGKLGQQRVRNWLETWWLRFSYVDAHNFGREEAIFAISVLDRLFGRKVFSIRRLVIFGVFMGLEMWRRLTPDNIAFLHLVASAVAFYFPLWALWLQMLFMFAIVVIPILSYLLFVSQISTTRWASSFVVRVLTRFPSLNLVTFSFLLLFQYLITVCFLWLNSIYSKDGAPSGWSHALRLDGLMVVGGYPAIFFFAGRLSVTALFAGSYLAKPLHLAVSTLWLRVIESDKPVFTLLFGGAAAVAQGIEAIVKALS
jgi:hypothetical protein